LKGEGLFTSFMRREMLTVAVALTLLGLMLAAITLWLGFTWAPGVNPDDWKAPEAYRILFWHVPAAWASFQAFTLLFIGSGAWFLKRLEWGWKLHVVGAQLGLVFGLCVIISGPIWGTAEWGTPWDLTDVRLNTYAILTSLSLFLVMGHQAQPDTEDTRDTFSSVGLFGFILVPITIMAIRIWQNRHPGPVIGGGEDSGLDPQILMVLLFGLFSFQILVAGQVMLRYIIVGLEDRLNEIQGKLDTRF
jgi:heme exporter protein C